MTQSKPTMVYSVGDLVGEMRKLMETSYPEIWIEGELSSLSKPASGHLYFSLKDAQATLRCAMFRNRANISQYKARSGDLVRVRAKISVYTARGDLQCIVQHIEEAGAGLLQRRYEELKAALNSEGLFSLEHKKVLPRHPQCIGLITSPSGAAVQDVLTTLKRRNPSIAVTIYPAVVQGEGAVRSICDAIRDAEQHSVCDCLLLTRGGGSMEDLWSFNDEVLARAIHACKLPIVSAIGHEVDITIADLVADLRAPTPTAAAEQLSTERDSMLRDLQNQNIRLRNNLLRNFQMRAQTVDLWFSKLTHPSHKMREQRSLLTTVFSRFLQLHKINDRQRDQNLNVIRQRFSRNYPTIFINKENRSLAVLNTALLKSAQRNLDARESKFTSAAEQLNLVSPLATLSRGYSITRNANKQILRKSDEIAIGDIIDVELSQGSLACEVNKIKTPTSGNRS